MEPQKPGEARLDSWKDIAAYLKRSVSTVQRWERQEGLPVHRLQHSKLGSLYAYPSELDAWWNDRRLTLEREPQDDDPGPAVPDPVAPEEASPRSRPRWALTAAALGVALLAVAAAYLSRRPEGLDRSSNTGGTAPVARIMLAVLPFETLSVDAEHDYFSDGLTEEVIAQLGRLQPDRLGVIARTSVMRYKKTDKGIDRIGPELGVDYVLEGSVRREAGRVRITAQLIQVRDQTHLWADTYEQELAGILDLQTQVSRRVVESLALKLIPASQARLARPRSVNADAYEAYLRGRHHANRVSREGLLKGIEYFQETVDKDPGYALGYAALAHTIGLTCHMEYVPCDEGLPKARAAATKALQLDPTLAEAHMYMADETFAYHWNWSRGEAGYRHAVELDPGSADVVRHLAVALHALGRYDEAIPVMERARRLDPLSPALSRSVGDLYHSARQHESAIHHYRKTIELDPSGAGAYARLGAVYEDLRRDKEALEAYLDSRSRAGDSPEQIQALRAAYRDAGILGYHRKRLEHLKAAAAKSHVSAVTLASAHARAGENGPALDWLDEAYERRNGRLFWLRADPAWDTLRREPRFQALMARMNFPQQAAN
jgi:TolB-like protein/Tfp pilus assembly protein PilF